MPICCDEVLPLGLCAVPISKAQEERDEEVGETKLKSQRMMVEPKLDP